MVLASGEDDDQSVTSMEGGWEVTLEVCEALDEMVTHKIAALPDLSTMRKHSSVSSSISVHSHSHAHSNGTTGGHGGGGSSGSGSGSGSDRENGTDREGNATDREIGKNASDKIVVPRRKVKSKKLKETDVRPEVRAMIVEYVKGEDLHSFPFLPGLP